MKTFFNISLFFLCGGLLFLSCTKIDEPYATVKSVIVDTNFRTVLLEDYTGHKCPNCAPAGTMANSIQENYHGQVFALAVHAGSFARPMPNDPHFSADFTSPAGDEWNSPTGFDLEPLGKPRGMINRKLYKDNISCQPTEWNSAVKIAVALPKIAVISVGNVYSEATMTLSSTVNVKFIQPFTGHVTLTVCILEDSLYGGQENNVPPQPIPIIENYLFMHVLRGSLNGSYGELIVANPTVNSVFSKQYSLNFTDNTWIPKQCHVLAFISDEDTYEILHVAKAAVIKR